MAWQDLVNGMLGSCLATFGEAVLHQTPAGLSYERTGIFNDTYTTVDPGGFEVITQQPNLGIRLKDWEPKPAQGDKILRQGVTYWVRHGEPDGEGGSTLILDKRSGISGHKPVGFDPQGFTGELA